MSPTAVLPIRAFDGLTRLSPALNEAERTELIIRLALRTATAAHDAGCSVVVATPDGAVRAWAGDNGIGVVAEPEPAGLDAAADAGVASSDGTWLIIHADLPVVTGSDIEAAIAALEEADVVLAPSHDGGTSLIGGNGRAFPFSYGVGSFRRHFAAAPAAAVVVRPGLAIDLDRARDLATLRALTDPSGNPSLV